jgi:hypothetical protein
VQSALESLQFVEKGSVAADIKTQSAVFTVTDKRAFDLQKVKDSLSAKGYPRVTMLSKGF